MKFWTHEQFSKFIQCVDKWPARVGFELLFWSGMRIGELLALTEDDFDFAKGSVTVSKNYQRIDEEDIISTPKTPKGRRTIALPDAVIKSVRDYIPRLYDYKPGYRLFPYTKRYYTYEKADACVASGVELIRLHDIRHSHAALLIEMDVPILLISERLGHEDVNTTLRTYGHLYPNRYDNMLSKLNALMGKPEETEEDD
jgi:integrase